MKIQKTFQQFMKFGIVGVSNTLISLVIYYILLFIGIQYIFANAIAFTLSVLNAFYWNRKYVFKSRDGSKVRQLVKVYVSYGLTFALSTGLLVFQVEIMGVSYLIAPLINLCITTPLNFTLNKAWAFRSK